MHIKFLYSLSDQLRLGIQMDLWKRFCAAKELCLVFCHSVIFENASPLSYRYIAGTHALCRRRVISEPPRRAAAALFAHSPACGSADTAINPACTLLVAALARTGVPRLRAGGAARKCTHQPGVGRAVPTARERRYEAPRSASVAVRKIPHPSLRCIGETTSFGVDSARFQCSTAVSGPRVRAILAVASLTPPIVLSSIGPPNTH